MTTWVSQSVKVTAHRFLNTSRGIIRCREFCDCDDTEVLNVLSSQGVSGARRLMSKRNGVFEPTNTFLPTFGLPTPPKSLKATYMKLDVEAYIPNPLSCYNFQRYGHGKATCNRKAVCAKCSQEGHQDAECENPPHCANCALNHCAYSRECPEWAKQKDITQVKFDKNISFGDAKKTCGATHPNQHLTEQRQFDVCQGDCLGKQTSIGKEHSAEQINAINRNSDGPHLAQQLRQAVSPSA